MQNTNELTVQQLLELDVQSLNSLDECADALSHCATEADGQTRLAVTAIKASMLYAIKGGYICLRARALAKHGEFGPWLEAQAAKFGRGPSTLQNWMKLSKAQEIGNLIENPDLKGLTAAYIAIGILPEPEPKPEGGEGQKERPPFVLSFKTQYRLPSEWQRDAARDFLYEFERLARLAAQLKTEFGL
jgi:hypothetical protein